MRETVSAQVLCHNEEEMIYQCLLHLESLKNIDEINITDSGSTDNTVDIILHFIRNSGKRVVFTKRKFDTFPNQRNFNQEQSNCDWTVRCDVDETFSQAVDDVLGDLYTLANGHIGVGCMQYDTVKDPYHRLDAPGPCLFMHRTKEVFYRPGGVLLQEDRRGKVIDCYTRPQTFFLEPDTKVIKKHHWLLKSDRALLEKWDNYKKIGLMDNPDFECRYCAREHWKKAKEAVLGKKIVELEEDYYDVITNREPR